MQHFQQFGIALLFFISSFQSLPGEAQAQSISFEGKIYDIQDHGGTVPDAIWVFDIADNPKQIAVCWEDLNESLPEKRDLVESAIDATWAKVSKLKFVGWGECADESRGIRIRVSDDGPHVKALGRGIDGLESGMLLNFTFDSWTPACQPTQKIEDWIVEIAIHEFGHAIGFTHEHNRDDTPAWCTKSPQGTDPTLYLTELWDANSKMNYCYCGDEPLSISEGDTTSVQSLYGAPG